MNIVFLAYRSWALNVVDALKNNEHIDNYHIFQSQKDFEIFLKKNKKTIDLIFVIGWSDILEDKIVNKYMCIGMHPSDLPNYKGGSPIQNQILDGITTTNASLFRLSNKIDEGDVYLKEMLSLNGDSISEIFVNIEQTSIKLFEDFLIAYPEIEPIAQEQQQYKTFRRRKPSDSRITADDFKKLDSIDLYNKIRCLTDPYPNAYFEDKKGRKLFFTGVSIEKKDLTND